MNGIDKTSNPPPRKGKKKKTHREVDLSAQGVEYMTRTENKLNTEPTAKSTVSMRANYFASD